MHTWCIAFSDFDVRDVVNCVTAGMITKTEIKLLDHVATPHGKWWVPFVWSCNLVRAARRQGRISDNYLMKTLLDVCTISAHIHQYCPIILSSYLFQLFLWICFFCFHLRFKSYCFWIIGNKKSRSLELESVTDKIICPHRHPTSQNSSPRHPHKICPHPHSPHRPCSIYINW